MAEEVNTSEQQPVQQAPQSTTPAPATPQDNQPDLSFLQYLPESMKLPAKPKAIDYYNQVVGNPLTGSNPGANIDMPGKQKVSPIEVAVAKAIEYENPYAALKPFTYSGDSDKANFERYYSARDTYNKLGFNPYADNESLYNKNMTFGDRFVRAAGQWDNLIASGFRSGVRSWKTIFTDPLAPDIEGAKEMEKIMAVGADNTGGLGAFFNNTFLNSGYTVGIGLNYLGEELALMGATALTGGVAGSIGIPAMVARTGSALNKMFEGSKIIGGALKNLTRMDGVRAINSIPEARSFWSTVGKGARAVGKGAFEIVNPLENTYQALKATDYATDFAKLSRTFGAFADDLLMMKNVVAEAKIEGGLVKINATQELIDQYVAQNGRQPEGKDLKDIEEIATKEAYRTAALNLPAISVTNKLMYATMLAPLRNVMGKQAVPLLEDIIFNKKTFTALGEGLLDKGSAALKSLAKPKFYGQFGMNYLKANLAEGVQENLQEAISYGAIQHAKAVYNNPVRAAHDGYMTDLMDGLRQQFSVQGAETFASGFLMGAFAQPIMAIPSMGISKLVRAFNTEQYEAAKQTRKNAVQKEVDILNEQYKSPLDFYAPDLGNAVKTGSLADDMYSAGRVGNKKEAMDAQAAIQNQHMITAFKTGKYDIIRKRLADYENFTAEETVEAFKKYGIEEKDYEKASAKIKEVIARADRTKEIYENVAKKYPNPINVSNYKRGTPERVAAELSKIAWDSAVENLVFAHATMDSHSKRIADIASTFSKISTDLAGEDAQSLMSMLSFNTLTKEIAALTAESKVLDDTIPAQKKIKAKKEKQLEKATEYYAAVKLIQEAKTPEEKAIAEEEAKKAFGNYVRFLANKNDKLVFNDSLNDAFDMVKDSMLLKNDMKGLVDSINVLMTPKNFLNLHARLFAVHQEAFDNKKEIIGENIKKHHEIKDINDALQIIYQNKLTISDESLNAIKEATDKGENFPETVIFVDDDGNPVTSGEKFDNAMKAWKVLLDLTKKPEKPQKTETTEEEEEEELQPFDSEDVSTYPKSLIEELENAYELLKSVGIVNKGMTIGQFIKDHPEAKKYIKLAELKVQAAQEEKETKLTLEDLINSAGSPEEVNALIEKAKEDNELTKDIIDLANEKLKTFKPAGTTTTTTTITTDIEAKKADIERRRQEELIETPRAYSDPTMGYSIEYLVEQGAIAGPIVQQGKSNYLRIKEGVDNLNKKINAKYDAELAALEGKSKTDIESERNKLEEEKDQKLDKLFESVGLAYTQKSLEAILERNDKRAIAFIEKHDDIIAEYEKKLAALESKPADTKTGKVPTKKKRGKAKKSGQLVLGLEEGEVINNAYKGKLIYISPTSKTNLQEQDSMIVDTDDLSLEVIREMDPKFPIDSYKKKGKELTWKGDAILDAIKYSIKNGSALRAKVKEKFDYLLSKGYTVITSSVYFIKDSDYVLVQVNPQINKKMKTYRTQDAVYEATKLNKDVVLIDQLDNEALKSEPLVLSQKDLEFINEDDNLTLEDLNKDKNIVSMKVARSRGYDAIYQNKRYAIADVKGNSVSLTSVDGVTTDVKIKDITSIVGPQTDKATKDDINTFKENEKTIQSGAITYDYDATDLSEVIKNIEDNIC